MISGTPRILIAHFKHYILTDLRFSHVEGHQSAPEWPPHANVSLKFVVERWISCHSYRSENFIRRFSWFLHYHHFHLQDLISENLKLWERAFIMCCVVAKAPQISFYYFHFILLISFFSLLLGNFNQSLCSRSSILSIMPFKIGWLV